MPTITVSKETIQRLEDRAIVFKDTEPEDVIRRLLDQTEGSESREKAKGEEPADLVSKGGRIPHGSDLRMKYKGTEYHAVVDNGKIYWNGESYSSPSKAAVAVIQSTGSDRTTADGWREWEVKTPESGEWRVADKLRNGALSEKEKTIRKIESLSEKEKEELKASLEEDWSS